MRTLPEMDFAELARFYPQDYWGEAGVTQEWIRSSQSEKTAFVDACGLEGGRILDVGCGSGLFLRALSADHWDRFGVETGGPAASSAAQALGREKIFNGTLLDARFGGSFFDAATFWSALEHTNQPRADLVEARRVLRPGGALIVQVPNAGSYQARWFGGRWFALDAPRHRYHFTRDRLETLLTETGFSIFRVTLFSKAHNAHALRQSLKSRLRFETGSTGGRALFYLAIPFIKPFDLTMTALGYGATLTIAARAI